MFCSTAPGRSNLEEMIGTWMTVLNAVFFVLVYEQMFNEVCVIFGFHSNVTEDLSLLDLA
jgi:hypothetical protein